MKNFILESKLFYRLYQNIIRKKKMNRIKQLLESKLVTEVINHVKKLKIRKKLKFDGTFGYILTKFY